MEILYRKGLVKHVRYLINNIVITVTAILCLWEALTLISLLIISLNQEPVWSGQGLMQ